MRNLQLCRFCNWASQQQWTAQAPYPKSLHPPQRQQTCSQVWHCCMTSETGSRQRDWKKCKKKSSWETVTWWTLFPRLATEFHEDNIHNVGSCKDPEQCTVQSRLEKSKDYSRAEIEDRLGLTQVHEEFSIFALIQRHQQLSKVRNFSDHRQDFGRLHNLGWCVKYRSRINARMVRSTNLFAQRNPVQRHHAG